MVPARIAETMYAIREKPPQAVQPIVKKQPNAAHPTPVPARPNPPVKRPPLHWYGAWMEGRRIVRHPAPAPVLLSPL